MIVVCFLLLLEVFEVFFGLVFFECYFGYVCGGWFVVQLCEYLVDLCVGVLDYCFDGVVFEICDLVVQFQCMCFVYCCMMKVDVLYDVVYLYVVGFDLFVQFIVVYCVVFLLYLSLVLQLCWLFCICVGWVLLCMLIMYNFVDV